MDATPALYIFPDTNVFIQAQSLHALPWKEFERDEIEIILCGPVIRELDRLKNKGGRPGRVARAVSSAVRDLMKKPDQSEVLQMVAPRVSRRLLLGASVTGPVRIGLDLTIDDHAIINQAIAYSDKGNDVLLLTDDNFAAMTASEFGLSVKLLPSHWLKPPEDDSSAKELARRDAEIARLTAAEPAPTLRFVDEAGQPIDRLEATLKRYLPVPPGDVERLIARVIAAAPVIDINLESKLSDDGSHSAPGFSGDVSRLLHAQFFPKTPVTKADIDQYAKDHAAWLAAVRNKITGFHEEWNARREWPRAVLLASNEGSRPATDVLVELCASGTFKLSSRFKNESATGRAKGDATSWLELSSPPAPPRPRCPFDALVASLAPMKLGGPTRPTPYKVNNLHRVEDAFYWREGKVHPVDVMSLECRNWRHARGEEDFPFRIWSKDDADIAGLITGRLSASNLSVPLSINLPIRIRFEDEPVLGLAEQLVDDLEARQRVG